MLQPRHLQTVPFITIIIIIIIIIITVSKGYFIVLIEY